MNLKDSLLSDMKGALKARDSLKLITIRGLISEIKNREIDVGRDLVEDEIISIILTQVKKRKEAAIFFDKGGRKDLLEKENQEKKILQEYLPEQVSANDLKQRVQELISELGITDIKDLGKIMKTIIPEFKGRADNEQIKKLVTECLNR